MPATSPVRHLWGLVPVFLCNGQIVIDKNTNISLTKEDIERNKEEYINELITEFDNFINMYIDNKTLVIVYNKSELRNMFFDNEFDSELIVRYLK